MPRRKLLIRLWRILLLCNLQLEVAAPAIPRSREAIRFRCASRRLPVGFRFYWPRARFADVAELADALASGASPRKRVEVQVLSSALLLPIARSGGRRFGSDFEFSHIFPKPTAVLSDPESFAQKRGLTPYRKGKPALQPQRVRGLSPFLGKADPERRRSRRFGKLNAATIPQSLHHAPSLFLPS